MPSPGTQLYYAQAAKTFWIASLFILSFNFDLFTLFSVLLLFFSPLFLVDGWCCFLLPWYIANGENHIALKLIQPSWNRILIECMESYWNIVCKQEKVNIKSLLIKFSHTHNHIHIYARARIYTFCVLKLTFTLWFGQLCHVCMQFYLSFRARLSLWKLIQCLWVYSSFSSNLFFFLSLSSFLDSDARIFKKNQAINHDSTFVRIFHTHTERESGWEDDVVATIAYVN